MVDAEDRRVLAGAMAMTDPQAASLAILPIGRAAVFSDGDDTPLLVQVLSLSGMDRPDDDEVAAAMAGRPLRLEFADLFRPHPGCQDRSGRDCQLARRLVEQDQLVQRSVSRLALALAVLEPDDDPAGYRRRAGVLWDGLWQRTRQQWRPGRDEAVLAGCLATRAADWWCARRGAGLGWTYPVTEALAGQLAAALAALGSGGDVVAGAAGYRRAVTVQHEREVDPLPRCADVCPGRQCLYRLDAAELVDAGELLPGWQRAREADRDGPPAHQWTEGIRAAWALAGPEPTAAVTRRAGLCAAQQITIRLAGSHPETAAARLDALVAVAGEGGLE